MEYSEEQIVKNRDINVCDDFWFESLREDLDTICDIIGLDIESAYFQLHGQGSGACIIGDYEYKKGCITAIKAYAPTDKTLHDIVQGLVNAQKPRFYGLSANISHFGRHYHEHSNRIEVYDKGEYCDCSQVDDIAHSLRDLMRWYHSRLVTEYDYQTSDKVVVESMKANGIINGCENGQ